LVDTHQQKAYDIFKDMLICEGLPDGKMYIYDRHQVMINSIYCVEDLSEDGMQVKAITSRDYIFMRNQASIMQEFWEMAEHG
jgi:hypothetical protein